MWEIFIEYVLPSVLTLFLGLFLPLARRLLKNYEHKLAAEGKIADESLRYIFFDEAIDFAEEIGHREGKETYPGARKEDLALTRVRVRTTEAGLQPRNDDDIVLAARVQRRRVAAKEKV